MNGIIVFSPHPDDDDVIGCGGSICKLLSMGYSVKIVYMTFGENGVTGYTQSEASTIRRQEAETALLHLGNIQTEYLGLRDGFISESEHLIEKMIDIIRGFKPQRIYLPDADDTHPDHKNTHYMVIKAAKYSSFNGFCKCSCKEAWRTKELLCYEVWNPIAYADYFEDISQYVDVKRNAIQEHKSQMKNRDYSDAILGLNRYRGVLANYGLYCEAFKRKII